MTARVERIGPDWGGFAAGCTLRGGGVSPAPYDTLNMGTSTGDDPARVADNRAQLAAAVGFAPQSLVLPAQVHGRAVRVVRDASPPGECDALVTDRSGLLLGVLVADCAPVLLASPERRLAAACHAGWRGLVAGVLESTIDALLRLGAEPRELLAWIGPCIGPDDFEVGPEVARLLDPDSLRQPPGAAKPLFDLPGALTARLRAAGLPPENVSRCPVSTLRDPRTFSHRRDGPTTGRMLAHIGMRD